MVQTSGEFLRPTGAILIGEAEKIAVRPVESPEDAPALRGAFFWLSAFYVVYCTRPEDWIPGLGYIPLAKITGVFALLGLLMSVGKTRRKFSDLPRESHYLLAMTCLLFISAMFSPVWKGGALKYTMDFAKVWIVWILTFLLVTDFSRLRRIIYIQSASVAVISAVSIVLGRNQARLEGVLGGIYSNPNDLALAIVLTLPFSLAFLLSAKKMFVKLCWTATILLMAFALFRTASRAGFVSLVISGAVCLWYFGVKGRRFYLLVATALVTVTLLIVAGGPLADRLVATGGKVTNQEEAKAYGSYEQRKYLIDKSLEGIAQYPILGLGVRNFETYSGNWHDVHVAYLQLAVEGGIPVLILFLLFLGRGFGNLRRLRRRRDLDSSTTLFVGALYSSMIAFVIGALFAPVAYQFFTYFSVAYTAVLLAMVRERDAAAKTVPAGSQWSTRYQALVPSQRKSNGVVPVSGGRGEPRS